jgi:MIP family channel proteins
MGFKKISPPIQFRTIIGNGTFYTFLFRRMAVALRALVAEFVGTFALIFIGSAAIAVGGKDAGLVGVAMAHGLVLAIMISALGRISGGVFNPAVTVGLWVIGKLDAAKAGGYILAQILGGLAGGYLLSFLMGPQAAAAGTPALASGVGALQGVVMEAVLTFFLMTAIMGTAVDPEGPKTLSGFGIGTVLVFDILAGGNMTGASMNPARTLGSGLPGGMLAAHWVYWVGPILGAVVAALLYQYMAGMRRSEG